MLVISRRNSEAIVIGDDIEIIVKDIGNDKVKLCINAPKSVPVMRKELLETRSLNQEASKPMDLGSLQELKKLVQKVKGSNEQGTNTGIKE